MNSISIIGHRGAAGLALENSRDSLAAALSYDVDAVEFDIRRTADGKLVAIHDHHTGRIADEKAVVRHKTLAELQGITLKDGQHLLSLEEVLEFVGDKLPVIIDIKASGVTGELLRILREHPALDVTFTSVRYKQLAELHRAAPHIPFFVQDHADAFEVVHAAAVMGARGISLRAQLMNPLVYYRARQRNLEIRLYTVDSVLLWHVLRFLYPGIAIYTNHPERFAKRSV
jgi:glycerophosphoryl diester phosphodiesterase